MSIGICHGEREAWTDATRSEERRLEDVSSEFQLVAAAQCGDASAFNDLCCAHRSMILRVAQRITGDKEDAQDAVQDALLSAYLALPKFNGRSKFQTWLTRIAINSALMIVRKRQGHRTLRKTEDSFETFTENRWEFVDRRLDPEKALLQTERERVVRDSIQALPRTLRAAAELSRLQERSTHEIATLLGLSVSAAKARLFRANAVLKDSRSLRAIAFVSRSSGYRASLDG